MRLVIGGVLLFLAGCAFLTNRCHEDYHFSPSGPPEAVERWWDDYLAQVSPGFAALLIEGSAALRREGKNGEWNDYFAGYGNCAGPIYKTVTNLKLPMPEACAERQRGLLAHVPPGSLVPDDYAVTHFQPNDEVAKKIWLQAACKLGYHDGPPMAVTPHLSRHDDQKQDEPAEIVPCCPAPVRRQRGPE